MKKYEMLKDQSIEYEGRKLYRIRALVDFKCSDGDVDSEGRIVYHRQIKAGDLGGYIEKESNLSHDINGEYGSWVGDDAKVMDNAVVSDSGVVLGNSIVKDNATVSGYGELSGNGLAYGNAKIKGILMKKVIVGGNSEIADTCCIDGDIEFNGDFMTNERYPVSIRGNAVIKGSINIEMLS